MDIGQTGKVNYDIESGYFSDERSVESRQSYNNKKSANELTDEEKKVVSELKKRDLHVKSHEQAHMAAGSAYIKGGATYEYQTGPDGKRYAVGGEVSIDTSAISGNPRATIRKMQIVKKAALAPSDPSPQDRRVASAASQAEAKARQELSEERSNPDKKGNIGSKDKFFKYGSDGKKQPVDSGSDHSLDITV